MKKTYGFVKCRMAQEDVALRASGPNHQTHEIQYHLHPQLSVSDDLVQYKIVNDFHHAIIEQLQAAPAGFNDLTSKGELPALDFLRSDILAETGPWRDTDPMDGDESAEPIRSIKRLLQNAYRAKADLYLFGRLYDDDGSGVHDIHMNQGSKGKRYFNDGSDKDGNLVWQDGAVIVNVGTSWSAYFAVFTQQVVPTDDSGNPVKGAHPITAADEGSERAR